MSATTIPRQTARPRARDFVTPAQLASVRRRQEWKSVAQIVHAWTVILGSIALVAAFPNPVTFVLAVMLIGSRQLGLAILMHDGAHFCLSANQHRNALLSQLFCAWPIFADTTSYRRYHAVHHAHTQQAEDPDLVLSAPFPITRRSYKRKFWRDITGQTGYAQRKAQVHNALGEPGWPLARRLRHFWRHLGPQVMVNAGLAVGMGLAGVWWAWPLLWLLPLLTWMMVITRVRNIAEHAVVPDSNDPLRNTRTTAATLLERAFIAPYHVNYHLEHHLMFYVPSYNLPELHRILMAGPMADRMEVRHGYRAVLRLALSRPDSAETAMADSPRRRSGALAGKDQAASGF
jgi:fatty acid desaturase